MNEQELKTYLKKHQPLPPGAEPGEMDAIFSRLEQGERPKRSLLLWGAPALAAASLALVLLLAPRNLDLVPAASTVAEEELLIFQEELPDQEVGEGYLQLAGLGE